MMRLALLIAFVLHGANAVAHEAPIPNEISAEELTRQARVKWAHDPKLSVELFRIAAEQGSLAAKGYLGMLLLWGQHVELDMDKGLRLAKEGATGENAEVKYLLAMHLLNLGSRASKSKEPSRAEVEEGVILLHAAAIGGSFDATFQLVNLLAKGELVPKDLDRANALAEGVASIGIPEINLQMAREVWDSYPTKAIALANGILASSDAPPKIQSAAHELLSRIYMSGEVPAGDRFERAARHSLASQRIDRTEINKGFCYKLSKRSDFVRLTSEWRSGAYKEFSLDNRMIVALKKILSDRGFFNGAIDAEVNREFRWALEDYPCS